MRAIFIRLGTHWVRNLVAVAQVSVAVMVVTAVIANLIPALRFDASQTNPTLFQIRYGRVEEGGFQYSSAFHVDDVVLLTDQVQSVQSASIFRSSPMSIVRVGDDRYAIRGLAYVSPGFVDLAGLYLTEGSFFTADEARGSARVGVISAELSKVLFGDTSPIGKTLNIRPDAEAQWLVGLPSALDHHSVAASPGTEIEIVGFFGGMAAERTSGGGPYHLLMPASSRRQELALGLLPGRSVDANPSAPVSLLATDATYSEIRVRVEPGMQQEAEHEITSLLNTRLQSRAHAQTEGRGEITLTPLTEINQHESQARIRQNIITGTMALAALIVASFAVFTTTMANIAQRAQTVGLARSIGATRSYVVREAMMEAGLVSATGGFIGALAAYPTGKYLLKPLQIAATDSGFHYTELVTAGIVSVALGVAVGMVAAIYPAWTVARLMPADALREGRA